MRALQLSGLSRNSPRPGLFGRPSNSATKNGPCTFSVQEPLLLIPSGETSARKTKRPGPRERVADALVFRRNHFCSALPGPDPLLAMKSGDRDHRESPHFLREPLLLMPSRRDRRPGKPRGQGCRKVAALFFRRNHFYSFLPGPRPVLAMKSGDRDRREPPHFVLEGTAFPHSFQPRLASPGSE